MSLLAIGPCRSDASRRRPLQQRECVRPNALPTSTARRLPHEGWEFVGTVVNKVLVVDDDEAIRETLQTLLEDAGYRVEEATEGMEALRRLRAGSERMVVLLDLMMPGLDGAGVLGTVAGDRRLMQQYAFILITANHNTLTLALANLLRNLDVPFVSKPFDVDHLVQVVDAAARRLSR